MHACLCNRICKTGRRSDSVTPGHHGQRGVLAGTVTNDRSRVLRYQPVILLACSTVKLVGAAGSCRHDRRYRWTWHVCGMCSY
jgi:hypothetical protein